MVDPAVVEAGVVCPLGELRGVAGRSSIVYSPVSSILCLKFQGITVLTAAFPRTDSACTKATLTAEVLDSAVRAVEVSALLDENRPIANVACPCEHCGVVIGQVRGAHESGARPSACPLRCPASNRVFMDRSIWHAAVSKFTLERDNSLCDLTLANGRCSKRATRLWSPITFSRMLLYRRLITGVRLVGYVMLDLA